MTSTAGVGSLERRAARLVRLYPAAWRARYGDEFAELLADDLVERPRSFALVADVARCAIGVRLGRAGLGTTGFDALEGDSDRAQTALATLLCATTTFLAFAVAMWAQLGIGWQWSEPSATGTTAAVVVMSSAMVVFAAMAPAAAVPVAWAVGRDLTRRRRSEWLWPFALSVAAATLLVVGARHFGNGWPGTGGHRWAHQGLVPGGVYAFAWAATMSVTSYWAHPGALSTFPTGELAWMAVSPLALVCLVLGAAQTLRRVELSPRALAFERRIGVAACFAMVLFMGAALAWIADGGPGPRLLFHVGAVDVLDLALMAGALVVVYRVVRSGLAATRAAG